MTDIPDDCGYHENSRLCHEPPVCVVRIGGKDVGLCVRHSRPGFHPADLRKRVADAVGAAEASRG